MLALFLLALQLPADCSAALAAGVSTSASEICLGADRLALAGAAEKSTSVRREHLQAAVDHYRRAAALAVDTKLRVSALDTLARLFDTAYLNEPHQAEQALNELIRLEPDNLTYLYRLSKLQEDQGFIDAAEQTLIVARRRAPDNVEPSRMLLQFYTRRIEALAPPEKMTAQPYRVGGGIPAPRRVDSTPLPVVPERAAARTVSGVVIVELTINESGLVTNARVLRSVPLLDEAALQNVRRWRFTQTMVNGQPVPVVMTVTVNFTPTPR